MQYAQIENGSVIEFGLSLGQVRMRIPNVSVLDSGGDLSHLGYALVNPTPAPVLGRWKAIREIAPMLVDEQWLQQWEVIDLPLSIADKVADIKRLADEMARQKRDRVVAGISPAEMASWPIKRAEALAHQGTGDESKAPALLLESQARGVSLVVLAEKVLAKAAQLAALEAGIAGRCGAIQDAAAVATTDAELLAIDLEAGWPV